MGTCFFGIWYLWPICHPGTLSEQNYRKDMNLQCKQQFYRFNHLTQTIKIYQMQDSWFLHKATPQSKWISRKVSLSFFSFEPFLLQLFVILIVCHVVTFHVFNLTFQLPHFVRDLCEASLFPSFTDIWPRSL